MQLDPQAMEVCCMSRPNCLDAADVGIGNDSDSIFVTP